MLKYLNTNTCLASQGLRSLRANKTGINLIIFHFKCQEGWCQSSIMGTKRRNMGRGLWRNFYSERNVYQNLGHLSLIIQGTKEIGQWPIN